MDLGRCVQLYPHDPKWMSQASHESSRLVHALGGSTAIAGIKAKLTIDLLGVCRSLDALDARADDVRVLGYEWQGEFGIPGRRFCVLSARGDEHPRFHLHMFEPGSSQERRSTTRGSNWMRVSQDLSFNLKRPHGIISEPSDMLSPPPNLSVVPSHADDQVENAGASDSRLALARNDEHDWSSIVQIAAIRSDDLK